MSGIIDTWKESNRHYREDRTKRGLPASAWPTRLKVLGVVVLVVVIFVLMALAFGPHMDGA